MRKRRQTPIRRYSLRATLAAIDVKITALKLLDPMKQSVVVLQKSIRHTPAQKLIDAFIAILAGAHGLAEINTRVRSDQALQRPGAERHAETRPESFRLVLRDVCVSGGCARARFRLI